jgi:hypothetical protein
MSDLRDSGQCAALGEEQKQRPLLLAETNTGVCLCIWLGAAAPSTGGADRGHRRRRLRAGHGGRRSGRPAEVQAAIRSADCDRPAPTAQASVRPRQRGIARRYKAAPRAASGAKPPPQRYVGIRLPSYDRSAALMDIVRVRL